MLSILLSVLMVSAIAASALAGIAFLFPSESSASRRRR
jgi:hypothetical protein